MCLEFVADINFNLGKRFYEDGDFEIARKYLSVSFGFNRYLERVDEMRKCRHLLESTGLGQSDIQELQNEGYDILSWVLDVYRKIHENEEKNS